MTPNDTSLLEAKNLLRRCLAHLEVLATDLESSKGLAGEVSRFLDAPPVDKICDQKSPSGWYRCSMKGPHDVHIAYECHDESLAMLTHWPVIPPPITVDLVERVSAKVPQGGVRNREWANERALATGLTWLPWKLAPDSDPAERYILVKADDDEVEHPAGEKFETEAEAWTAARREK